MKALWILLCRFLEFLVEEGDLRCSPIPERTLKKLDIAKEQLQPTARELYNRRFGKQNADTTGMRPAAGDGGTVRKSPGPGLCPDAASGHA